MSAPDAFGTPPHPLVGRQRLLVRAMRLELALAVVLATVGLVDPGGVGHRAAVGFVVVIVAAPIVRVVWLCVRWMRRHDRRYAAVSVAVLVVVAAAAITSL